MSRKPLLLLPLLAIAAGLLYWQSQASDTTGDDQSVLYGNVEIREAQLAFNGSEHLAEVLVEEGDRVKAGQVLARLHTELLTRTLEQARAQLNARQAQLDKLLAGSRPEEIAAARAKLDAAKARARAARDTWLRLQSLLKRKLTSTEEVEVARANAEAAAAEREASAQNLKLLQAGARAEDIAAARAELASAKAALALATQHLADAELSAPRDGIIRDRLAEPGEFVTPQNPVLTLAFTSPVWVRTYLPEAMLGRIQPGTPVTIHTDSYPDKAYPGWIGFISPTAEFTPKNVETPDLRTRLVYEMRAFACNPDGELRLGMPATVQLDLNRDHAAAQAGPHHCGD